MAQYHINEPLHTFKEHFKDARFKKGDQVRWKDPWFDAPAGGYRICSGVVKYIRRTDEVSYTWTEKPSTNIRTEFQYMMEGYEHDDWIAEVFLHLNA